MAQPKHSSDEGTRYSRYFSPKEYQADPQNWAVLQDESGVMIFGNGDGIMTFDGSRWHLIPMTNNNLVRSLAFGPDQTLYVGGYNEIGYIKVDAQGSAQFVSLVEQLNPDQREFGHVWGVLIHDNKVFFSTDKNMLVWNNDVMQEIEIPFENKRALITTYQKRMLVQPPMESLFVLEDETLKPLQGGEFYRGKRITGILPYGSDTALICTMEEGLFLYDGKKSEPFQSEVNEFLQEHRLYKSIRLRNGNFALGTLTRGVVVIDPKGSLVHHMEKGKGLGDNAVYNLSEDHQGSLWVTMSVGISRVELHTPMTWFNENNGLEGAVNDIIRFENNLYAATMLGFYQLRPGSTFGAPSHFEKINQITSSVWAMTARQGSLLLATDQGTVELKNGRYTFLDDYSGAVILASQYDPSIVYIGLADGVVILQFREGRWRTLGAIPGVEADVGEMNEDRNGNLWLGTFSEGVMQLQFPQAKGQRDYFDPQVFRFGEQHGLPVGYVQIHNVGGELLFRVEPDHTIYHFDSVSKIFTRYRLNNFFPERDSASFYPFTNESRGKLWMVSRKKQETTYDFLLCTATDAGYKSELIPFGRVREDVDEVLFMDQEGVAWMGGLDGIVRFTFQNYTPGDTPFRVILNEIRLRNDSVLYSGSTPPVTGPTFSYDYNTLAFSFGATSFDLHEENEYQYMLEGFDEDWSTWTNDTEKSYTRIPEGRYVFRVRARNIYGGVSPDTSYAFVVSPPWYRHVVAYIAYALLLVGMMYMVVKARSQQLEKEKSVLEKTIQERTIEISNKNIQLEQQAEELKAQTEQLKEMDRIKSNFFTNISHEFRTPLSLIIAPLEKELQDMPKRPESEMMYRNARRLQNLINQLLDLSKLESGQMKVFLCRNDLTSFIKMLLSSFQPMAQSKNITFIVSIPERPTEAYFDADKLETILNNLLSNAFKFTPEGGEISFRMSLLDDGEKCEFTITDTGAGIPANEISRIFDRFYQVDSGTQREFEGSGIGLALTRELVLLMQGDISASSEPGKGASFRVVLPFSKGENTVIPEEIAFTYTPAHEIPEAVPDFRHEDDSGIERYTILLAEDNNDLSSYLTGILEKVYRVIATGNGEEALVAAKEVVPDLILSDMMMPKMDGFTLCEEIRKSEITSHIPFILLTARSSVESRLAGLELGADDYLTKPFHVTELQIRIRNLLQQRNNLKKRFRKEVTIAPKEVTVTSTDEKFLLRVMEVVESNLSDVNFSVEHMSHELGMSRKSLHRKLVALVGQTPTEFIRVFRLKKAMRLLEQQSGNVKEVAFGVGFNNLSYFAKCFREQFDVSPTEVKALKKFPAEEN